VEDLVAVDVDLLEVVEVDVASVLLLVEVVEDAEVDAAVDVVVDVEEDVEVLVVDVVDVVEEA